MRPQQWTGWNKNLLIAEFTYNNSFQVSIRMAPYEVLYVRKCWSPLHWSEVDEKSTVDSDIVQEAKEKVCIMCQRLLKVQSRQKNYFNKRQCHLKFSIGDHVFLKVSPTRGVKHFGMRGKLIPHYIGSFDVLEWIGPMEYRIVLPRD